MNKYQKELILDKVVDIIDSIAYEKDLSADDVERVLTEAIINTAKKTIGDEFSFSVDVDKENRSLKIFQNILVVDNNSKKAKDIKNYITIEKAKEIDEDIEIGDEVAHELTFENLGRNAINLLYGELEYKIQGLVGDTLYAKYKAKVGKVVNGTVVRIDNYENTYIEIDEVRAVLSRKNRIKGESFKVGNVVKSILKSVHIDREGMNIELSRTTPKLLEELLRLEVPEINDGNVIIEKSARIPGVRAKVGLSSDNSEIDAVGSTVGVKGLRINSVSRVLSGENIDCIEYSKTPEVFVSRALSPAIISSVKIDGQKAIVSIPKDQKSKAIGKSGVNIRLASMLTGYQIELHELDEIANKDENKESKKSDLSDLMSLFKED